MRAATNPITAAIIMTATISVRTSGKRNDTRISVPNTLPTRQVYSIYNSLYRKIGAPASQLTAKQIPKAFRGYQQTFQFEVGFLEDQTNAVFAIPPSPLRHYQIQSSSGCQPHLCQRKLVPCSFLNRRDLAANLLVTNDQISFPCDEQQKPTAIARDGVGLSS